MEFGQVVLLCTDGSEGQVLTIRKDVTFGCCSPAHIRIKSKSVDREHARIHVDTNGVCSFLCLNMSSSSSSRPRINGVRMSSKRHGNIPADTTRSAPLHHLDVITIAGRSFLFKSKRGLAMDMYNSRIETETVAMAMAVCSRKDSSSSIGELDDDEVDSMSLDSRSSRWSTSSQVSIASSGYNYVNNTNTSSLPRSSYGHVDKPFARLCLLKKDGTEGSPYTVMKEVTFGSQRPANIRIKSTSLEAEHAKLIVDFARNQCSLVHLASHLPPKVNGRKMRAGAVTLLRHNDVISLAGRDFAFRTDSSSQPCCDIENVTKFTREIYNDEKHTTTGPATTASNISKTKRNKARSFGTQFNENNNTFHFQAPLSPLPLQINTNTHPATGSDPSPLHSLSSLSSLSASESDVPMSPQKTSSSLSSSSPSSRGILVLPLEDRYGAGAGAGRGDDVFAKSSAKNITYNRSDGEKTRQRVAMNFKKRVQFEGDIDSVADDEDEDEDDDEMAFFDIIAEADRLMLSNEEQFAVDVDYNRLVLPLSTPLSSDEVNREVTSASTDNHEDDTEACDDQWVNKEGGVQYPDPIGIKGDVHSKVHSESDREEQEVQEEEVDMCLEESLTLLSFPDHNLGQDTLDTCCSSADKNEEDDDDKGVSTTTSTPTTAVTDAMSDHDDKVLLVTSSMPVQCPDASSELDDCFSGSSSCSSIGSYVMVDDGLMEMQDCGANKVAVEENYEEEEEEEENEEEKEEKALKATSTADPKGNSPSYEVGEAVRMKAEHSAFTELVTLKKQQQLGVEDSEGAAVKKMEGVGGEETVVVAKTKALGVEDAIIINKKVKNEKDVEKEEGGEEDGTEQVAAPSSLQPPASSAVRTFLQSSITLVPDDATLVHTPSHDHTLSHTPVGSRSHVHASYMGNIACALLSLAAVPPLSSADLISDGRDEDREKEGQEAGGKQLTQLHCGGEEEERKKEEELNCCQPCSSSSPSSSSCPLPVSVLILPPAVHLPLDMRRTQGDWFLHTFRYLSRAWRGFF